MKTRKSKKVAVHIDVDKDTGEIMDQKMEEGVKEAFGEAIEEAVEKAASVYLFEMPQLVMKNARWEMHINILKSLPAANRNYKLNFVVNLDPLDEQIDLCLERMNRGNQTDIEGRSVEQEEHQRLLNAKQELIDNCPEIELIASVIKSEFKAGETRFVFMIPADVINKINDRRNYIENYKLKLTPLSLKLDPVDR